MLKNIILMGPPAAGKGTLAKLLEQKYNLAHISTGDMFREAISNGTELGKIAKAIIDDGNLVPDEITIALVKERLSKDDCANGFLLDGFPRTIAQAKALKEFSKEINRPIEVVVNLDCDEDILIKRISGRRVCPSCGAPFNVYYAKPIKEGVCDMCGATLIQRADDNEQALKVRLDHYANETKPLIDFYLAEGKLKTFNSLVEKDELLDQVSKCLFN